MALSGKSLVFAMCIGQVGNLLPHVVVPAVMVKHLIPLWQLSSAQAGLMATTVTALREPAILTRSILTHP